MEFGHANDYVSLYRCMEMQQGAKGELKTGRTRDFALQIMQLAVVIKTVFGVVFDEFHYLDQRPVLHMQRKAFLLNLRRHALGTQQAEQQDEEQIFSDTCSTDFGYRISKKIFVFHIFVKFFKITVQVRLKNVSGQRMCCTTYAVFFESGFVHGQDGLRVKDRCC